MIANRSALVTAFKTLMTSYSGLKILVLSIYQDHDQTYPTIQTRHATWSAHSFVASAAKRSRPDPAKRHRHRWSPSSSLLLSLSPTTPRRSILQYHIIMFSVRGLGLFNKPQQHSSNNTNKASRLTSLVGVVVVALQQPTLKVLTTIERIQRQDLTFSSTTLALLFFGCPLV